MNQKIDPENTIINFNDVLIPGLNRLALEDISDEIFDFNFSDFIVLVSNLSEEKLLQYNQILQAQYLQKKRIQSYCEQICAVRVDYHKSVVNNERVKILVHNHLLIKGFSLGDKRFW